MNLQPLFEWLESWSVSVGIRQSWWMFPAFESVHVIAIALVVGSVMVVDLRVLGLAGRRERITELSQSILPWTWVFFGLAALSGSFLFAAKAHTYFDNFHFRVKMLLILLAGLNMLVFHFGPYRSVLDWDRGQPAPAMAKLACGLSLGFWVLVVVMGRWIGFSIEG